MTAKTEQEKQAYLAHLNYEVSMLKHSYERIANPPKEPADCNAFIECFAVHARALYEFLTNKTHGNQNALARDFVAGFVPSGDAECISTIIDKIQDQILHTGWTRGEAHTIKFGVTNEYIEAWIEGLKTPGERAYARGQLAFLEDRGPRRWHFKTIYFSTLEKISR